MIKFEKLSFVEQYYIIINTAYHPLPYIAAKESDENDSPCTGGRRRESIGLHS